MYNLKKFLIFILIIIFITSCKKQNKLLYDTSNDLNYLIKPINEMTMVSEYGFDVSAFTFDCFEFGTINNQKIKWFLLDKTDKTALLVSRDVLEIYKYYQSFTPTNWIKSDIRTYLNNDFFNSIFNEDEKNKILKNENDDMITILDTELIKKYFGFINNSFGILYEDEPEGAPNQKLISKLINDNKNIGFNNKKHFDEIKKIKSDLTDEYFDEFFDYANNCVSFWLKDDTNNNYEANIIDSLGYLSSIRVNSENIGIRPVLMVSLE